MCKIFKNNKKIQIFNTQQLIKYITIYIILKFIILI